MADTMTEQKAFRFHELHRNGNMLILPNIWDPLGAALLEKLEYPAVATASASVALTSGYNDGENIPLKEALQRITRIAGSVNVPVTADIESGYAANLSELQTNIRLLLKTGIVGINIEDSNKQTAKIFSVEEQCERIYLIKKVSSESGIPLFINARTDVYIKGGDFNSAQEKFEETLRRGKEYVKAGANCIFPIAMKEKKEIEDFVARLQSPVNILAIPGIPSLSTLNEIGVVRLSLGPSFLKIAIKAMKDLAVGLKNYDGLNQVEENDITTDYLKSLVK